VAEGADVTSEDIDPTLPWRRRAAVLLAVLTPLLAALYVLVAQYRAGA
jgi:hypothetical protein